MLPREPAISRGMNWRTARSTAAEVVALDVDRAERAAAADFADRSSVEHERARLLPEAELVVEVERVQVGAEHEVRRAARAHVLGDGLDELAPDARGAARRR